MKITLGKKIISCFILVFLLYGVTVLFYILPEFEKSMYREKDISLKEKVDSVISILNYYYDLEQKGILTTLEAQERAKEVIGKIRYDENNYFWIDNTDVVNVLLPQKPEWEGKSRAEVKDSHGKYMVRELVRGAVENKEEGFYLDYWFPKLGEEEPSPKRGYVKLFEPWGWVVGTGVYIDDVEKMLAQERKKFFMINIAVVVVGLTAFSIFTTKYISTPLNEMAKLADKYADGNFEDTIKVKSRDEIGRLADSLNSMAKNLKQLIGQIVEASNSLASHSQQMAASSEEVSAATEEVASTTNKVSSISEQTAENAETTYKESEQVLELAQSGDRAVKNIVDKIDVISNTTSETEKVIQKLGSLSSEISKITDVITDLAERTNLLALNAAIEAARAGEHGRGFAVVAEEVRTLAEQSSRGANDIAKMVNEIKNEINISIEKISESSRNVEEGVELANEARKALQDIVDANKKSVELTSEITNASKQVNDGTQQLASSNEQITSAIQQIAASAQELADLSSKLQSAVSRFKV
ncbi:MAG: methyl-accepting chemotaxis protein [Desulfotomaculum sp.]|nr:methyl-accepting chemotaxis protein [Desulfotomaculum sp.]